MGSKPGNRPSGIALLRRPEPGTAAGGAGGGSTRPLTELYQSRGFRTAVQEVEPAARRWHAGGGARAGGPLGPGALAVGCRWTSGVEGNWNWNFGGGGGG